MNRRGFLLTAAAIPFASIPNLGEATATNFDTISWETLEWIRCREDVMYFAKKYIKLNTFDGAIDFVPYVWQEHMLHSIESGSISKTVYPRCCGKTTFGAIYLLHQGLFLQQKYMAVVSPRIDHALPVIEMIEGMYERLPKFIKDRTYAKRVNRLEFRFSNDSYIVGKSSQTNLRGTSFDVIFSDEFKLYSSSFYQHNPHLTSTLKYFGFSS